MSRLTQPIKKYFVNLFCEYRDVFKDIHKNALEKPYKASAYGLATLFVCNMFRTNEDLRSYKDELVRASTKIFSLSEQTRNKSSHAYIEKIGQMNVEDTLRQIDLGLATIIYRSDYGSNLGLFRATCKQLQPSVYEIFKDRMVDVGILGQWLLLETKMKDYDINDEEWHQEVS